MATTQFEKAVKSANLPFFKGIQAINGEYRKQIETKGTFTGSVDLDEHFKSTEPQSPRWDYGVGVEFDGKEYTFWIEPHPASSTGEIEKMLKKLDWLKDKLNRPEFFELKKLTQGKVSYYWLYSGSCRILKTSPEAKKLAKAGLPMPIRHLTLL